MASTNDIFGSFLFQPPLKTLFVWNIFWRQVKTSILQASHTVPREGFETRRLILSSVTSKPILQFTVVHLRTHNFTLTMVETSTYASKCIIWQRTHWIKHYNHKKLRQGLKGICLKFLQSTPTGVSYKQFLKKPFFPYSQKMISGQRIPLYRGWSDTTWNQGSLWYDPWSLWHSMDTPNLHRKATIRTGFKSLSLGMD